MRDQRRHDLAFQMRQARERDLLLQLTVPGLLERRPDGAREHHVARQAGGANDRAPLRRDTEHPFAEPDLRAHPGRIVPVARDRVEALACLVGNHDERVHVPEQRGQTRERAVEERVEIEARGQVVAHRLDVSEVLAKGCRLRLNLRIHRTTVEHAIHIHATEREDPAHAGLRRHRREPRVHALEHRAFDLRPFVLQVQPVLIRRLWRHDDHLDHRVVEHVLPRLVEELIRQADMPLVQPVHDREVRHVRRAIGGTRADRRGNDTFEARRDRIERRRQARGRRSSRRAGRGAWRLIEDGVDDEVNRDEEGRAHEFATPEGLDARSRNAERFVHARKGLTVAVHPEQVFDRRRRRADMTTFELHRLVVARHRERHGNPAVSHEIGSRPNAGRFGDADTHASPVAVHMRPPCAHDLGDESFVTRADHHRHAALDERRQRVVHRGGTLDGVAFSDHLAGR